jgi:hypothetical protein
MSHQGEANAVFTLITFQISIHRGRYHSPQKPLICLTDLGGGVMVLAFQLLGRHL